MRTNPVEHRYEKPEPYPVSFGIYKYTLPKRYGELIHGTSRGYNYDVYVDGNKEKTFYKLYMVYKNNKWVKSVLKYFSNNKLYKEVRSIAE